MNKGKTLTLTILGQNHVRKDWYFDFDSIAFELFFSELADDLAHLGIRLERTDNRDHVIDVNSYSDLLNAVRIASPSDGFSGICIGHILGKSPNCDILEDIKRSVNRIAFAPETVHPEESNLKVCHNCGCGC
jgi:hypothetical protein